MNTVPRTLRATASCALFLLLLVACGCRSTSHAPPASPFAASPAADGTSLDDIDARNRESIATQLGRPVALGPATPAEVAAMTHAGVEPRYIICYINRSTNMPPITAADVIYLHEQGVNEQVIQAMLTPGNAYSRAEVARSMPPRFLFVQPWPYYGYPYDDPYWGYSHLGVAYGYGCRCY
jgi:hypothetical protein